MNRKKYKIGYSAIPVNFAKTGKQTIGGYFEIMLLDAPTKPTDLTHAIFDEAQRVLGLKFGSEYSKLITSIKEIFHGQMFYVLKYGERYVKNMSTGKAKLINGMHIPIRGESQDPAIWCTDDPREALKWDPWKYVTGFYGGKIENLYDLENSGVRLCLEFI